MFQKLCVFFPLLLFTASAALPAQVASRTVDITVFYYDSLQEAVAAVGTADATADNAATTGTSIEQPDEITLLVDIVLDAPLTIKDGQHIRLVPGGSDRTIHRSPNLIEYPLIWLRGDFASISLGKPGMGHELVIDGGCLNSPPIEAHAPLISVSGPGAKLIMYDKVTLQNNKNVADVSKQKYYQFGSGVIVLTEEDPLNGPEFNMKGGTIRGNINAVISAWSSGGGVHINSFGIFTMEGGVIMNNTAYFLGGGFLAGSRATFKKTGGIIYGSDAPAGYRNISLNGGGTPPTYGHSVVVAIFKPAYQFRDDTVGENDNLTYIGVARGNGTFGKGEKWDNPDKAFWRMLLAVILPVLALAVCVFLIYRKITLKKLMKIAQEAANTTPETVFETVNLTDREKEVGTLLLSELSMKQIAAVMHIAYTTVDYHARKLYRKMKIQGRTELLIRMRNEK